MHAAGRFRADLRMADPAGTPQRQRRFQPGTESRSGRPARRLADTVRYFGGLAAG